jgi:rare lipoprotein A
MAIEKQVYRFVLTIISIHFALSGFGCHKSKNSVETQKALKSQTGLASFYGSAFHGKKTASGEKFDQTDRVAAHPSYPLGTVARVTNLKNNKSIEVRIIDRGPTHVNYSKGIIIDLSKSAAQDLGFIREGRAHVRVEVLEWGRGPE